MATSTMSRSDRTTTEMRWLAVSVLCAAAISGAAAVASARADTFSYPAFDGTTTRSLVAATNSSVLLPAGLLFDHDGAFAEFNRTEGFLLLSETVDVWRPGPGGGVVPALEASLNTSFTLAAAAAPVAFVVLNDRYPLYNRGGLRGFANYSSPDDGVGSAGGSLASVVAGPVRSYGPDEPAVGLNVTVTPNGTAPSRFTVWVEYDAAAHQLSVRVAGAGEPRPTKALLDARIGLAGGATTEKALVGFFAAAIQDIIVGVRDWELTVDRFPGEGDGKKGTSWWVILLAVLGSVAATAAIVAAAVCYFQSRRRRQLNDMQPPKM